MKRRPHLYRLTFADGSTLVHSAYSKTEAKGGKRGVIKIEQCTDPVLLQAWGKVNGEDLS